MRHTIVIDDLVLVTAMVNGDQSAFEAIYRKYAVILVGFARRTVASREDCEEIVQEVFESLWKRRAEANIVELRPYLFRMVRNKIFRYFSRSQMKRKYAEHYALFETLYDQMPDQEITFEVKSLESFIDDTITKLPERCRAAFTLRLRENLSNHEIAVRMNLKKDTVENYMVTAIAHLRNSYKQVSKSISISAVLLAQCLFRF